MSDRDGERDINQKKKKACTTWARSSKGVLGTREARIDASSVAGSDEEAPWLEKARCCRPGTTASEDPDAFPGGITPTEACVVAGILQGRINVQRAWQRGTRRANRLRRKEGVAASGETSGSSNERRPERSGVVSGGSGAAPAGSAPPRTGESTWVRSSANSASASRRPPLTTVVALAAVPVVPVVVVPTIPAGAAEPFAFMMAGSPAARVAACRAHIQRGAG